MSTIQIRIDEKTKKQARKIFKSLGLDMSTAIKLYLEQVTIRKGIPFLLYTENGLTIQQEQEILNAAKEANNGKNISNVMNAQQFLEDLDN